MQNPLRCSTPRRSGEIPLFVPAGCSKIVRFIKRLHQQLTLPLATWQYDLLSFYRSIIGVNGLAKPAIQVDIQI